MFPSRRITTMGGDSFRDVYSLAFDGTNDNIRIPVLEFSVHDASFSFVFWVKRGAEDAAQVILGNSGTDADSLVYFTAVNDLLMETDSNADLARITPNVEDLNWHHCVIVCSSGTVTAYQDGVACSLTGNVDGDDLTIDTIGGSGSGGTSNEFNGNISEIAIYNTTLYRPDVIELYNGREPYDHKNGLKKSYLKHWWRMGDGTVDTFGGYGGGLVGSEVNPTVGAAMTATKNYGSLDFSDATYWTPETNLSVTDANTIEASDAGVGIYEASGETTDTIGKTYRVRLAGTLSANTFIYRNAGDAVQYFSTADSTFDVTFYYVATHAQVRFYLSNSATLDITTYEKYQIGDNAGAMINMGAEDFSGDTP